MSAGHHLAVHDISIHRFPHGAPRRTKAPTVRGFLDYRYRDSNCVANPATPSGREILRDDLAVAVVRSADIVVADELGDLLGRGRPNEGLLPPMRGRGLLGRDRETAEITRLLDGVREGGGARVIRGEAGIGKSALLTDARLVAADRAMTVVTAYGVRSETDLPFAGLHQIMRAWLTQLDGLPPLQRDAIRAAFGMSEATAPEPFMIALAALAMLGDAAARAPLLLAVEDAHWLDRPTADVLAFIGRRLESDSIVLLATVREGYRSPLLEAGLPQLRLRGLSDYNARELLDQHFPHLTATVRERVLEAAEGNPLALLELPLAVATRPAQVGGTVTVPLTMRLEDAFASRAAELPSATRTLLRIAAADERASLAEVISAAAVASGARPSIEDLVPATDAQLIDLAGTELRFRHPLVASAMYQTASVAERHAAHAALARVLHDPDRQVWHRAAAVVGLDDEVAAELQEVGRRAQKRGANAIAAAAFERAALLTRSGSSAVCCCSAQPTRLSNLAAANWSCTCSARLSPQSWDLASEHSRCGLRMGTGMG